MATTTNATVFGQLLLPFEEGWQDLFLNNPETEGTPGKAVEAPPPVKPYKGAVFWKNPDNGYYPAD